MSMNPHSDWVISRLWKIIKKRKKLPNGNFIKEIGNFFSDSAFL